MPMPYSCPVCLFARIYIRSVRLNLPVIVANGEEGVIFDIRRLLQCFLNKCKRNVGARRCCLSCL